MAPPATPLPSYTPRAANNVDSNPVSVTETSRGRQEDDRRRSPIWLTALSTILVMLLVIGAVFAFISVFRIGEKTPRHEEISTVTYTTYTTVTNFLAVGTAAAAASQIGVEWGVHIAARDAADATTAVPRAPPTATHIHPSLLTHLDSLLAPFPERTGPKTLITRSVAGTSQKPARPSPMHPTAFAVPAGPVPLVSAQVESSGSDARNTSATRVRGEAAPTVGPIPPAADVLLPPNRLLEQVCRGRPEACAVESSGEATAVATPAPKADAPWIEVLDDALELACQAHPGSCRGQFGMSKEEWRETVAESVAWAACQADAAKCGEHETTEEEWKAVIADLYQGACQARPGLCLMPGRLTSDEWWNTVVGEYNKNTCRSHPERCRQHAAELVDGEMRLMVPPHRGSNEQQLPGPGSGNDTGTPLVFVAASGKPGSVPFFVPRPTKTIDPRSDAASGAFFPTPTNPLDPRSDGAVDAFFPLPTNPLDPRSEARNEPPTVLDPQRPCTGNTLMCSRLMVRWPGMCTDMADACTALVAGVADAEGVFEIQLPSCTREAALCDSLLLSVEDACAAGPELCDVMFAEAFRDGLVAVPKGFVMHGARPADAGSS